MQVRSHSHLKVGLGLVLFALGVVLALVLVGLMIWADLEANLFDPSIGGDKGLAVRCPPLVVAGQTGRVSALIRNPLDREATLSVRTHVSEGFVTLMRQEDDLLTLPPGDSQRLAWDVTSDDAVYDLFILAKVHQFGHYPLPSREGACGILSINVPLVSGNLVFGLLLIVLVLCLGGGMALWHAGRGPLKEQDLDTARAMAAVVTILALGLLAGLMNWWLVGLVLFAILLVLLVAILGFQVERRKR